MAICLFAIATFFAFQLVQFVYVASQAVVGYWIGGTVEAISVGTGPVLWSRLHRGVEWRISWIPTGGYTKFYGMDDADEHHEVNPENPQPQGHRLPFRDLSVVGRLLLMLTGPATNIAIGFVLLLIPVAVAAPQTVVGRQAVFPVEPRAVPKLGLSNQTTTWTGQEQLFRDTLVEFWKRLVTFESMTGWGTFVGWLVTCSAAATVSAPAWFSCFGIVCVGFGLLNLVPLPVLNGGHIMFLLMEAITGRRFEKLTVPLTLVGMLIILPTFIYLFVLDAKWCIATFGGK